MASIIKRRVYRCCDCGNVIETTTNHVGLIYPICRGRCRQIINPHTEQERVHTKQTAHEYVRDVEDTQ